MTFIKRNGIPKLNDDLKGLITLSNNNFSNIDDALSTYIQFGIDKIGFEFGAVNKNENKNCITLQTISTNKILTKDKADFYCYDLYKRVIKTRATLTSLNDEITFLHNIPSEEKSAVKAIICTPLIVEQKLFGTLTFCTTEVRKKDLHWDYCVNMVEILGQSISKILKEQIDKNALKTKSKHLKQFNTDLKTFAKIGVTHYPGFSDNLMAYINFGKKITGFENAFIGEINDEIYTIMEGSITSCKSKPGDQYIRQGCI